MGGHRRAVPVGGSTVLPGGGGLSAGGLSQRGLPRLEVGVSESKVGLGGGHWQHCHRGPGRLQVGAVPGSPAEDRQACTQPVTVGHSTTSYTYRSERVEDRSERVDSEGWGWELTSDAPEADACDGGAAQALRVRLTRSSRRGARHGHLPVHRAVRAMSASHESREQRASGPGRYPHLHRRRAGSDGDESLEPSVLKRFGEAGQRSVVLHQPRCRRRRGLRRKALDSVVHRDGRCKQTPPAVRRHVEHLYAISRHTRQHLCHPSLERGLRAPRDPGQYW
eukprot:3197499-Rhodomonas_salina.2